jgi:hypothetical protein
MMPKDSSFPKTILLTLIYFGIGFLFLENGWANYGWIFFVLLPISLGVAIGSMPKRKWAYLELTAGFVIFVLSLIFGHLEGIVCVIMSIPIIIPLVWAGVQIKTHLIEDGYIKPPKNLNATVIPLLLFMFDAPIERYIMGDSIIAVKTEKT